WEVKDVLFVIVQGNVKIVNSDQRFQLLVDVVQQRFKVIAVDRQVSDFVIEVLGSFRPDAFGIVMEDASESAGLVMFEPNVHTAYYLNISSRLAGEYRFKSFIRFVSLND